MNLPKAKPLALPFKDLRDIFLNRRPPAPPQGRNNVVAPPLVKGGEPLTTRAVLCGGCGLPVGQRGSRPATRVDTAHGPVLVHRGCSITGGVA